MHALEETASALRWWQTRSHAPAYLGDKIERLERDANVLRGVIGRYAAVS